MASHPPTTGLQLRSTVKKEGRLELSIESVATPEPGPDDVLVTVRLLETGGEEAGVRVGELGAYCRAQLAGGAADGAAAGGPSGRGADGVPAQHGSQAGMQALWEAHEASERERLGIEEPSPPVPPPMSKKPSKPRARRSKRRRRK